MKFLRIILFFICLAGVLPASSQNKTRITILHSDTGEPQVKKNLNKLIGNVKLKHNDVLIYCDSLYQHQDSNYVEAFGNVHAIQNDTLNLWGDFMNYNGNTGLAQVRNNVILKDPKITLTTDYLDYDAVNRIGYYFNRGTIKDNVNTLISDEGYYFLPQEEMFFKDSVVVYTPDYIINSDTLKYQTQTKIITILGPTYIYGDNRTLYSEEGWYSSLTSHSELYKNNVLSYNEYVGRADTIIVDSISSTAFMHQHIHLYDSVNNVIVEGNYGEVLKNNDYAFVTDRAMLTLVGQADSIFVHGDTLSTSKDSIGNNVLKAYYNTKFYNAELQGVCDSMVFPVADSTVYLYKEPIVWASGNQMTGTDINMHMKDNQVDRFHLNNKAMIVNQMDTTKFNQIKGRNMTGFIRNNELYRVDVDGSGEALYYPDDRGIIIGMDKTSSPNIRIYIEDKKVSDITFVGSTDGQMNPLFLIAPEDQKLKDFQWHIDKKPLKKEDIFKK